ncbi:MAG TPA: hypothetical protein VFT62_04725 [Mycobacteriales bacterium]|nr:hypothetical protein [Mycobacteriales bacterium]
MTVPPRPTAPGIAVLGLLAVALVGAIAAAAVGAGWGTVGVLTAVALLELVAARVARLAAWLDVTGLDIEVRAALRLLAVVLLAARTMPTAVVIGTAIAAAGILALHALRRAASSAVTHLRRPPLLSRNLDLGDLRLPRAPRQLVRDAHGADALPAVVAAVGLATADRAHVTAAAVALAVATALAALPPLLLALHALRLHRRGARGLVVDAVQRALEQLRPDVVVYFAGTPEETYQPEMWFAPVEQLRRSALVVLRDPEVLERLAPTSLPVVCAPYNGTIARLPLPPSVPTLFVTHSGNNAAMLRRPEARTVFVGHGDSDKPDSVNPIARVYEQVWVAGPLGRRRYAEAGIGVADEAIVEIGRPQLRPPDQPPVVPTVLYAPTWEGWGDDPHHSSLPHIGPELIRDLLGRPGLRVLYRPHPLTGRRDPRLRAAHAEVLRLLRAAGAQTVRLPRHADGSGRDLLDVALAGRETSPNGRPEPVDLEAAAWNSAAPGTHRIIDGSGPSLASCFAQASVLIADVSSVISDYLVVDRPYGIVDTRGLGAREFRRQFSAAAGGFVLAADLTGLDELLGAADGDDPTRRARRRLTRDALGDPLTAQQRFAAAVDSLLSPRR